MNKKITTLITLVAFTFVTLFSPFPGPTGKVSAQATVNTGSLRLVTNTVNFSFKKDLMLGDTDPDVKELQKILNSSPDTAVASSGSGSQGQESSYFGALTKTAVIKFQEKYRSEILTPGGITAGNGIVGQSTRAKLNLLLGVTTPTLPSVGLPQSRAGNSVTSAPAVGMTVCKFIDLLVSINVVTADRANSARSSMGCVTVTPVIIPPAQGGMAVCSFIDFLTNVGIITSDRANQARPVMGCVLNNNSYVTVRANGSDGPISVLPGTEFRLSWHSENTRSCSDGSRTLPVSGSVLLTANTSLSYPVSCIGNDGNTVTGSVTVIVSNAQAASSTIQVLSSAVTPGYNFVTFEAQTNVPTKMVIAYTSNLNSTSSVKVYESATTTVHSDKITGLVPNTVYYAQVAFIAGPNDAVITQQITFTTLSDASQADTSELTQRVLSSSGGSGIVSIPGSESLKTDKKVTLEAWVKPTSWNTKVGMSNTMDSVIISKGNIGGNIDYVMSLDNGRLVYSNNDASIWTNSPVVPLNKWTHVAVSVNEASSNISFYVNGTKISSVNEGPVGVFSAASHINKANAITEYVATTTAAGQTTTGGWDSTDSSFSPNSNSDSLASQITSNVYLGNFYPAACNATSTEGNGFIGLIDDVKIWDTARTAEQIKTDIATTSATSTASTTLPSLVTTDEDAALVAHYSFDDGRATDLTTNGNNGAIKGDMEILDDATAPSPVAGSDFGSNGIDFSFPEACDANLHSADDTGPAGYEVTFKGGVKTVVKSGQNSNVTLETCDDPMEDLVKSVKVIGSAPARDPSYYNTMGTIMVSIAPGLFSMKTPVERDTIDGTAVDYISGAGSNSGISSGSVDSVGVATKWTPQTKSCMKPPKSGMGNYAVIGAIVLVVAAVVAAAFCVPCLAYMTMLTSETSLVAGLGATGVGLSAGGTVVAAGVGYMGGSMISCEDGGTGCN